MKKTQDLPDTRILRKMGIARDQEGIMKRFLAEEDNWKGHLENTREYIRNFLKGKHGSSVAVLGSGWLLDVPAEYLLANFEKVVFCDIRHPKQILQKYQQDHRAEFMKIDLTGGLLAAIYEFCRRREGRTAAKLQEIICERAMVFPIITDFYISVNLLNQLDILLVDYLLSRIRLKEEMVRKIRAIIQGNHLRSLPPGRSCLITDCEEVHLNAKNEEISRKSVLFCDLPSGTEPESWTWQFDTRRTYHPKYKTRLEVKAISF